MTCERQTPTRPATLSAVGTGPARQASAGSQAVGAERAAQQPAKAQRRRRCRVSSSQVAAAQRGQWTRANQSGRRCVRGHGVEFLGGEPITRPGCRLASHHIGVQKPPPTPMSKTALRPMSVLSECPESCSAVRESAKPMVMNEKRHMNVTRSSVIMRCSTMMRMPSGLYTLTAKRHGNTPKKDIKLYEYSLQTVLGRSIVLFGGFGRQ